MVRKEIVSKSIFVLKKRFKIFFKKWTENIYIYFLNVSGHCDQHHHGQQQQHGGHSHHREAAEYAQIAANATLPRNKKNRNKKDSATISGHSHGGEVGQEKTPYAVSQSLGKELSASSLPSSNWLVY